MYLVIKGRIGAFPRLVKSRNFKFCNSCNFGRGDFPCFLQ